MITGVATRAMNPGTTRPLPTPIPNSTPATPISINGANGHGHGRVPLSSNSFSPIRRSNSGSSFTSSLATSSSPTNSEDSPSPNNNSLLNSSTTELFELGSFTSPDSYTTTYSKTAHFVNGVKVRVPAEYGRLDHSAVLYEDNMYIFGGVSDNDSNLLLNSILIFNFASRSFVTITPAGPTPRYQHSAIVFDGQMIVFGGGWMDVFLNDLVVFNFETQTWSEIKPTTSALPQPRRGHATALVGRNMFVFGGYGNSGALSDIYKFDLDQKVWSLVETSGESPLPRFLHSCCVHNDSIYVFGGTNADYIYGDLFVFNTATSVWENITASETQRPSPRLGHVAVATADSMYIIGGSTDNGYLDAYEYYFDTRKWFRVDLTARGVPRQGHSALLRGESIFLFGGVEGPNNGQLDLLSVGTKEDFEDDLLESVQDEEVARTQAIPRSMWEATLLKKHPEILQYRELTRPLTNAKSYARTRQSAATEDPAHLNHQLVLNLIVEYLHSMGCSKTAHAIANESKVPYFPLSEQPESRLVMILKILKSRAKTRNIFDAEFAVTSARTPDAEDPEVELVDHMVGAGRVDAQMDGEDVDIWTEPEDSRKNIMRREENGKSTIKAANLNKLVQVLTFDKDKAPDAVYLKTFFYTYQSFTSPELLLKKLIQKYNVRPEKGVVVDDRYKAEVVEPVQTRVCRVLKFWIEQCPWDFNGPTSEKLLNNLNAFIDGPLSRDGNFTLVKQLRNSITKSLKKKPSNEDEKTITAGFNPPEPKTPRNIFSHSLSMKDVDELEIARQLTLIEFSVFSSVTPPEFLCKGWDDHNPKKSPHLKELRNRSADLTRWVAGTILKSDSKDSKRSRSKMLEKFIKVADQLRQIRNFQTAAAVIAGFNHPSIMRLSQTFADISPRAKELYQELVAFLKDDKSYRDIMRNRPLPCIPNLNIVLEDLASLQDTTPDNINNLINFQKRQQIYIHITRFQEFQQKQFNLLPVYQIASLLNKLPKFTDKELEELSLKCES